MKIKPIISIKRWDYSYGNDTNHLFVQLQHFAITSAVIASWCKLLLSNIKLLTKIEQDPTDDRIEVLYINGNHSMPLVQKQASFSFATVDRDPSIMMPVILSEHDYAPVPVLNMHHDYALILVLTPSDRSYIRTW